LPTVLLAMLPAIGRHPLVAALFFLALLGCCGTHRPVDYANNAAAIQGSTNPVRFLFLGFRHRCI